MEEERIILPAFVIADLYKSHLIEPQQQQAEIAITDDTLKKDDTDSGKLIPFLGGNKNKIILIVSDDAATFINDDELSFLTKILNACNLTIADIAIINTYNKQVTFDKLIKELNAEYMLLFGVETAAIQLPFTMPHFQVQQFSKCSIVRAPALSGLLADTNESVALKKQLWASLQKIFKVK